MGIFDRLGNLLKTYLDGENDRIFQGAPPDDPDLRAAFEELNDFLGEGPRGGSRTGARETRSGAGSGDGRTKNVPEALRPDFAELELPFGSSLAECKRAYKRLLKLHHPDRHALHAENTRRATEKSARINAAYERLEKWALDSERGP
ncbi:MAG: J domain-containing protein [Treponema sp.]|jgi:DnaJ-domain-containing protein 1|nr:J domain-containing protein [Treponema sp.]